MWQFQVRSRIPVHVHATAARFHGVPIYCRTVPHLSGAWFQAKHPRGGRFPRGGKPHIRNGSLSEGHLVPLVKYDSKRVLACSRPGVRLPEFCGMLRVC